MSILNIIAHYRVNLLAKTGVVILILFGSLFYYVIIMFMYCDFVVFLLGSVEFNVSHPESLWQLFQINK